MLRCDISGSAKRSRNKNDENGLVGESKTGELKAIFDISKILLETDSSVEQIKSPQDIFNRMKIMSAFEEESVCCILLDTKNKVIDQLRISKGSDAATHMKPFRKTETF